MPGAASIGQPGTPFAVTTIDPDECRGHATNASPSDTDRQPAPPHGMLRSLLSLPIYLYRAHLGFLLGHRFLVLVHEGRRSGRRHETPLEVVRYDRSTQEATVVAGWGRSHATRLDFGSVRAKQLRGAEPSGDDLSIR